MKFSFVFVFIALLVLPKVGVLQEKLNQELHFEVNKTFPSLSYTKDQIDQMQSLFDLNKHYKSSWVREYKSVEISTVFDGDMQKISGENELLSKDQKHFIKNADNGAEIEVVIRYIPENTLSHNDVQEINISFFIDPEIDAVFAGGQEALMKYLKESAISKLRSDRFKEFQLAAVHFTIDEDGKVADAHIFDSVYQPHKDEKINQVLLEAICNMPNWTPAQYSDGTTAKQNLVLTVGSMESCIVPLLNIRQGFQAHQD